MLRYSFQRGALAVLSAISTIAFTAVATAHLPDPDHIISQKGKRFGPSDVALHTGERVTIINDDGNLIHHAYVDDPAFKYDSGDIDPGAKAVITFPKDGDFTVLCGIHPKMKLTVRVR
jgi:plastocyanin